MTRKTILVVSIFLFGCAMIWMGSPAIGLTQVQEIALTITLLASILWISELVPLFVVSFLILGSNLLFLNPNLETPLSQQLYLAPFFSNIILLFLGGFVLSRLFQSYSFDKQLAAYLLKLTKGEPKKILMGVVAISAGLSMWMSNTATAAVVIVMLLPICHQLEKTDSLQKALFLAVPFACNIGGFATPIGSPPNAIALSVLAEYGIKVSFLKWFLWTFPVVVFLAIVLIMMLLKAFRPSDRRLDLSQLSKNTIDPSPQRKIAFFIIVLTILGWMSSSLIGVSSGMISLLPIVASFSLKILDEADFRSLPWDVLFMVAGGVSLGVTLDVSQTSELLISYLTPEGDLSFLALLMTGFAAMGLSTFMSNTATAGLSLPIVAGLASAFGKVELAVFIVTFGCSMAMALPISTPPNSIAFSSGVLKSRDMLRIGGLFSAIGTLLVGLVALAYWSLIF